MNDFDRPAAPTRFPPGGNSLRARIAAKLGTVPAVDHNGRALPEPDQALLAEAIAIAESADPVPHSPTGMRPNPAQGAAGAPPAPAPRPANVRDAIRAQAAKHGN